MSVDVRSEDTNDRMQEIFAEMDKHDHEQVIFCRHKGVGLKAIIAIHSTQLGPALGGCRMLPYNSTDEALEDALKLSRGMTYKCALADVDYGGGKMVLIGDPQTDKSPDLFRVLGRFIEGLSGRYFTGPDMGTGPDDFVYSARESDNIIGLPQIYGGAGNTSIPTAIGLLHGIRATLQYIWGSEEMHDRTISVLGVGNVGGHLVKLLVERGAKCIIADINKNKLSELKELYPDQIEIRSIEDIIEQQVDIFSPCARGGILNDHTIPKLSCRGVVGAANNQLLEPRHDEELYKRGILYAPDYLVNSGGLIQVADEIGGYSEARVLSRTAAIYDSLLKIYQLSASNKIPTCQAADKLVLEKLSTLMDIRRILIGFQPQIRER